MKRDSKIVLSIVFGGLFFIIILILGISALIGSSNSTINMSPNGDTVAIIPLQGEIGYGSSVINGGSVITPETVQDAISKAEADSSVSSILLDVNSPGGSPVASEEIMEIIKDSKKPVVVWISDVGASGAYLAASSADKIVASPSSMVGSIGVIMELTDLSKYYQMNGINKYSIKAGQYKDMGADYRNLTTNEKNMLQGMVDQDYDHFITIVSDNRHLDKNYTSSIAEGKIYTGTQAKDLKLVDDTGGKTHALDIAAKLGGIKGSYNTVTISTTSGLLDLLNSLSSKIAYSIGLGIGNNLKNGTENNVNMPSIY
ncbi:signal peptide peptidase SppA [Methanobacterium sp. SMA-27]|uniref:signal peptide peptidase SppA n=1 Tax=Methanobacterium sp. SMA-27 TaxID=1495336 RepID=UPI00064F2F57|nr:signal peptide peptidase SppA [Methanobacterium sp. SMA-27]